MNKKRFIDLLIIILVCIMAFSGYKLYSIMRDAKESKEQYQQSIADGLQGSVDGQNHIPDGTALEVLGRLCNQGPDLTELSVPCGKGTLQILYDPVIRHWITSFIE